MTLQDIIDDEWEEGFKHGINQGRIQNVRDMIKAGITSLEAVKASGLYTAQELIQISAE